MMRGRRAAIAALVLLSGSACAETAAPAAGAKGPLGPGTAEGSAALMAAASPAAASGGACTPTADTMRGEREASGTVVRHCDDVTDPAKPVWRAGAPVLGWFEVTDHGARPDDDACDQVGIQKAVDAACAAGGGMVYVPRGTYRICGAAGGESRAAHGVLIACADVHLRGESIEATVFRGEPGVRPHNDRTMFRFLDAARVSMARCTIDGLWSEGAGTGWGNGIRGEGVREADFRDMRIVDHFNHNISLKPSSRSSDDNTLENLVTENGRQTNIIVYSRARDFGGVKNRRNRIVNCTATGSEVFFGLEIRYSDDTEVTGGLYARNRAGGINVEEGAARTRIAGAVMRNNPGSGLVITGKEGRVVETACIDCVMEENGADGVRNGAGDQTLLRNCRLAGNGRHGYVDAPPGEGGGDPASRTRFEDCAIVDNSEFGIVARGGGHVLAGGRLHGNRAAEGRAGVRLFDRAAREFAVEGTRFAPGP